jgi:hypothetical protein
MTTDANRKSERQAPVANAYLLFGLFALITHDVAGGEWTSILTISALSHCFGIAVLCIQVYTCGSAEGISAAALTLDAWAFAFRLSNTLWLEGYIPVDATGDYLYQVVDVCSLLMILWLLNRLRVEKCADSFPNSVVVSASLALGAGLKADVNLNPLFDTFWMASVFIGAVSVVPQLALTAKTGGRAKALTSHYLMALALSRFLQSWYMWVARVDVTCVEFIDGFNHAVWAIIGANIVQILLLGDFIYYYVRSCMRSCLGCLSDMSGHVEV